MTTILPADELVSLADTVLLPCFDGITAPDWLRRRVSGSLGGVCLFARNIRDDTQVRELADSLRNERPDLVLAVDEEAGDVTRLDAATGSMYPGNAALGRVDDPALTAAIGAGVGRRLAAAGITLNFAPCSDVATDPANPVIGTRSFGADPRLVARHTAAYIVGQQSAGVAACAKHFPGHGGTDADTHLRPAVLAGGWDRLSSDALPPFTAAIEAGVAAIMAGHLLVPEVDGSPATVSGRWLTEILRGDMGFDGLVVTDALEMEAIAGPIGIAEGAIRALAAGADLLCLGGRTIGPDGLDAITVAIADAVRSGRITEERLVDAAERVRRLASGTTTDLPAEGRPVVADDAVPDDREAAVAGRALQVRGPLPPWRDPVVAVRCIDRPNIAVGDVPWGPRVVDRGITEMLLAPGEPLPEGAIREAGTVLVVTRDRHRHRWMQQVIGEVRSRRADSVLLEMGSGGVEPVDRPAVASFGATMANTRAALTELRRPGATQ